MTSSLYVHGTYVGFYIDMIIEIAGAFEYFGMVTVSMSLYVGLCAYAKAMVDDIKARVNEIDRNLLDAKNNMENILAVIDEIKFHYRIIR